jgi:hypothetical protein
MKFYSALGHLGWSEDDRPCNEPSKLRPAVTLPYCYPTLPLPYVTVTLPRCHHTLPLPCRLVIRVPHVELGSEVDNVLVSAHSYLISSGEQWAPCHIRMECAFIDGC